MSEARRPSAARPADPRTNTVVKVVLRTGLTLALALLLVGLLVQLASGHDEARVVKMFALGAPRSLGETIMGAGILVLALTPVSGVVALVASWLLCEHDARFVGVGVAVLVVLAAAVVVGLAG